ncbi:MAG: ATP-binding cassette domain-containing protein [Patescibacteria group bacterium]|jgi:ABC-type lipoprotein export system ATPase subunit/ABC-type antimicrobial peptide transport system permease subunit
MAPSQTPQIVVENLKKDYLGGKVQVLRGVNFSVSEGEFVVILGPSGCGKSTLLGLLAALDTPSSGGVKVYGQSINDLKPRAGTLYRRHEVGMVFQQFNLVSTLTAKQNVALPLILAGIKSKEAEQRAQLVLEIVGLAERAHHRPVQLSGGEQQRVAIGRALALDPTILLVDEPTGNLDEANSAQIIKTLQEVNSWGRTVIMVTHNRDYMVLADRVLEMKDGTIRKQQVGRRARKVANNTILEKIKNFVPKNIDGAVGSTNIFKLAGAHLRSNKLRTFFAIFGIALGIGAIVGLISLGIGLHRITSNQLASFNTLVSVEVTKSDTSVLALDNSLVEKFQSFENVELVSPTFTMAGNAQVNSTSTAVVVSGLQEEALDFEGVDITKGTFEGVVISASTARNYGVKNPEELIGKNIAVQLIPANKGDQKISFKELEEALSGKKFTAVISGVSKDDVISAIYMPLEKMKNTLNGSEYSSIKIKAKSRKNVADIRKEVEKLGLKTKSVTDLIERVDKVFLVVQLVLALIGSVALLVALLGVVNIMTISLIERTHEVGIMKAIGAGNADIGRMFASEASILGLLGGGLGVLMAVAIGAGLNGVLSTLMRISGEGQGVALFYTPWGLMVGMVVLSFVVARFAGWYPSRRAAKLSAMEALRNE